MAEKGFKVNLKDWTAFFKEIKSARWRKRAFLQVKYLQLLQYHKITSKHGGKWDHDSIWPAEKLMRMLDNIVFFCENLWDKRIVLAEAYNENRYVFSKRKQFHWNENVSPKPPIGLQWTMTKPSYHKEGWPKYTLYTHIEQAKLPGFFLVFIFGPLSWNPMGLQTRMLVRRLPNSQWGQGAKLL